MVSERRRKNNRESQRRFQERKRRELIEAGISSPPPSGPVEIRTAEDLRSILAEQINLVRMAKTGDTLTRARCVGYLCGVALRNLETGELEKRLEALEAKVNETNEVGSNRLGIVQTDAA